MCLPANNHILDCGREGLANTIRLLDDAGIYHSGAGLTEEQAAPVIFTVAGKRVAFASYNHSSTNPGREAYPDLFLNSFDLAHAMAEVRNLKAEIVVVSIHWGTDYSFFHEPWQRKTAEKIAEEGADIIMGHHSHTLQAFEIIGSTQVFYGLGSLAFGDFEKNGKMYALFRRTKHSALFFTDPNRRLLEAVATHELKGNYIVAGSKDIMKRNDRLLRLNRIREKNNYFSAMLRFHEKVLSRIYEYFFGYYMNPLARLFQFRNFRKVGRLLRQQP
ncbi:MAG: CapA family protein [Bacteroidales bacterium]|nr:CapA family protein [Bacteroidales bacterium]